MEQKAQETSGIVYPCAPCRIQRRKCGDNCPLAPYFPPNDPHKFLLVHRLFGTSKVVKTLRDIPGEKRADAVSSMVYEASARVYDPIFGCAGIVHRMQKQVLELQSQLESARAELLNAQANLVSLATGFYNGGEAGTTLGFTHGVARYENDLKVLQDDEDLFGW
ncbi:hypothetical protein SUGI_0229660 [Cryptomeria japonica]|nr:hypothetical protein SUGI_0229660 [Cryptomeria japonica]